MKKGIRFWTDDDDKAFKELSTYVESAQDIADWFNVTVKAVYNRAHKLGVKLQKPIPKELHDKPLSLRIWLWENKISPYLTENQGCLEWNYAAYHHGYGQIRVNRNLLLQTHRVSYEVKNKTILTPDEKILHKCDNPRCNNPSHLFKGTQRDNVRDMMNKKRGGGQFPKGHHCKQITVDGVTKSLDEWVVYTGFKKYTIVARLHHGWSEKDAVTIIPEIGRNQFTKR